MGLVGIVGGDLFLVWVGGFFGVLGRSLVFWWGSVSYGVGVL